MRDTYIYSLSLFLNLSGFSSGGLLQQANWRRRTRSCDSFHGKWEAFSPNLPVNEELKTRQKCVRRPGAWSDASLPLANGRKTVAPWSITTSTLSALTCWCRFNKILELLYCLIHQISRNRWEVIYPSPVLRVGENGNLREYKMYQVTFLFH